MHPSFRDYFYFNRSERKGIIVLLSIILVLILAKEFLYQSYPISNSQDPKLDSLLRLVELEIKKKDSIDEAKRSKQLSIDKHDSIHFYDFDPNGFPAKKWQDFGLTEKQAAVIKRYEASGGNFRSKKDVKKMFVISDKLFASIKQHILLPDSIVYENKKLISDSIFAYDKNRSLKIKVDINTADTAEFKKLFGIGKILSIRIVEYRERLGGFYSKHQLKEIYGLKSDVLARLDTQLVINEIKLRKLNVNKFSTQELKDHPYINWKVANSIVKYREQHGDYQEIQEIKRSVLVGDSLFQKIKPYLEK